MSLDAPVRFVIHDGRSQYTRAFDDVFCAIGATPITTPPRAPKANAFAERWVRTVRHELLDRTLIWNQRQLHALLADYVEHYNQHRPHRSLDQRAPSGNRDTATPIGTHRRVDRTSVCGGLINEYRHAA